LVGTAGGNVLGRCGVRHVLPCTDAPIQYIRVVGEVQCLALRRLISKL
jgi:hypothetical protein